MAVAVRESAPSAEARALTVPAVVGRFEVLRVVAQGGMGVVCQARDVETGEPAALKILRALEPGDLESFRREVYTLGRLRHPGVVRVLAQGVDDGVPWYAMEFIAGPTLARFLEEGGERAGSAGAELPSAVLESLRLIRRLCFTLAFLHGEGIVHRDLKPSNVIVRADGAPVLVDFGLVGRFAALVGREALEAGGDLAGTIAYIAPEQIQGEFVDARADLYSLGCVLYEAVTGMPPFAGTAWEVMQHHLATPPAPPSGRARWVPRALEELILRLLAKEPRARVGYAVDVARRLGQVVQDRDDGWPATVSYLYRSSFVGRRQAMAPLAAQLERASEGHGQCTLVAGESGVGKTRLAMELTREAARRGFTVATGQCAPLEGEGGRLDVRASPLHPFRPLLRLVAEHCRLGERATTDRLLGRRGKILAPYEPALRELPGQADEPEPAPLPAPAARARLLQSLVETIVALAAEAPLLVVLDDLQWADELTLACVSLLATVMRNKRTLVVGTYRTEERNEDLRALACSGDVTSLGLGRIDAAAVSSMVSDMLALASAPGSFVEFLTLESEGNPFFVCEYLRTAVGAGILRRSDAGEWRLVDTDAGAAVYHSLGLPHTLHALVARRLEQLSPPARFVLDAAAVIGRDVDVALVAALVDLDETLELDAMRELLARQVLEEIDGRHLRFTHDKVREVAYGTTTAARRMALHTRAAAAIEARGVSESDFALLAYHFGAGGVDEKALEYLGKAGEHALRTGAAGEARRLFEQAIALDERTGRRAVSLERARWRRLLGEAHVSTGAIDDAIVHTGEALRVLGLRVPEARVGWALVLGGELARQSLQRLLPRGAPREPARAACLEGALGAGQIANAFYYKFDLVPGVASSLRCVNLAERAASPGSATLSYAQLAYIAGGARLHRLARRYFERAYAERSDLHDPTAHAAALYFEAMYRMGLGQWEPALRLGRQSLALLEQIANRQEAEIAGVILAHTLFYAGQVAEADAVARRIVDSAAARANHQHQLWALSIRGRSRLAEGAVAEALDLLERGAACLRHTEDFVGEPICEGLRAKALLVSGELGRARDVADAMTARLPRRPVPLAQCLDGYAALAEVYLGLWARATEPAAVEAARAAGHACRNLRRFARLFPIAAPAAHRCTAWAHWLSGRHGRALRLWRRSAREARQLGLPVDEARAHLHLAQRESCHREEARRLLRHLGHADATAVERGEHGPWI